MMPDMKLHSLTKLAAAGLPTVGCKRRCNVLRFKHAFFTLGIVFSIAELAQSDEVGTKNWFLKTNDSICQFDAHSVTVHGATARAEYLAMDVLHKHTDSTPIYSQHVLSRQQVTERFTSWLTYPALRCGSEGTDDTCIVQLAGADLEAADPLTIIVKLSPPTTM